MYCKKCDLRIVPYMGAEHLCDNHQLDSIYVHSKKSTQILLKVFYFPNSECVLLTENNVPQLINMHMSNFLH